MQIYSAACAWHGIHSDSVRRLPKACYVKHLPGEANPQMFKFKGVVRALGYSLLQGNGNESALTSHKQVTVYLKYLLHFQ